jgi:hypothetical protein
MSSVSAASEEQSASMSFGLAEARGLINWLPSYVDGPIGKRELYVLIPLVSCGHMSGL